MNLFENFLEIKTGKKDVMIRGAYIANATAY